MFKGRLFFIPGTRGGCTIPAFRKCTFFSASHEEMDPPAICPITGYLTHFERKSLFMCPISCRR